MIEIMPFPENNIILFYWTAPKGVLFIYGVDNGIRTHDLQSHNLTR